MIFTGIPLAACGWAVLVSRLSVRKIGGLTGDVYGAIVETGELFALLLFGVFFS